MPVCDLRVGSSCSAVLQIVNIQDVLFSHAAHTLSQLCSTQLNSQKDSLSLGLP